jgi:hypothetical protein
MKISLVKKTIPFKNKSTGESVPMPCFIPAFRSDFERAGKYKDGGQIFADFKTVRLNNYNDQYHAVMGFVFNNLPESYTFRTIDQFANWTKIKVGFTEEVGVKGEVYSMPRESKYSECDQQDFMENIYNPAMSLWENIIGVDRAGLIEGSLDFSAQKRFSNLRGHGGKE